jgi:hypothetical protein
MEFMRQWSPVAYSRLSFLFNFPRDASYGFVVNMQCTIYIDSGK